MDVYKHLYEHLPKIFAIIGHPAFGGIATVVGLVMLYFYGKEGIVVGHSTIINPDTRRPFEQYGDPKKILFQKASKVFLVSLCLALAVWLVYAGPLANYIFVPKLPEVAPNAPTVPDLHYNSAQPQNSGQVVGPPQVAQGTAPTTPAPSPTPPTTTQPPTAAAPQQPDSLAECPKEAGQLTASWNIYTNTNGMPMGLFNLNYTFDQAALRSLFPLLQKSISPQQKRLNSAQFKQAIDISDEISSRIPTPAPMRINQQSIPYELTLISVSHSFVANSEYLEFNYSKQLPSGQDRSEATDKILIKSLSANGQHAISEFDKLAKSWGDDACKDALSRLLKPL